MGLGDLLKAREVFDYKNGDCFRGRALKVCIIEEPCLKVQYGKFNVGAGSWLTFEYCPKRWGYPVQIILMPNILIPPTKKEAAFWRGFVRFRVVCDTFWLFEQEQEILLVGGIIGRVLALKEMLGLVIDCDGFILAISSLGKANAIKVLSIYDKKQEGTWNALLDHAHRAFAEVVVVIKCSYCNPASKNTTL